MIKLLIEMVLIKEKRAGIDINPNQYAFKYIKNQFGDVTFKKGAS